MEDPIYIIGHKNPDPDAICSAIAYASYKHAKGETHYRAARCGNSNARIDAILNHFKVPLPLFVGDVTPCVKDILHAPHSISLESTCACALRMIDQHDVRALPVVDASNELKGLLSIYHLGEYFIPKPDAPTQAQHVKTSMEALVRSLNATVHHLVDPYRIEDIYVRVAAMALETFGHFTKQQNIPFEKSAIVVGNRLDVQKRAIECGVRLLVITGGLGVDPDIIERAKAAQVSLIESAYDTTGTAWTLRCAAFVHELMDKEVFTCSPEEKLIHAHRKVADTYVSTIPVVNEAQKLIGVFTRGDLINPKKKRIVLVDHNELSQAVNGAGSVDILEIIDHHRLGNPPTHQPIRFRNEPVGSTCTIVADMFRRERIKPPKAIAGMMMAGMIADTLCLRGPTTTDIDRELLPWLAEHAETPIEKLSDLIFSSGSVILSEPADKVIRTDCKVYNEGTYRFGVSQVEELGFDNFNKHEEALKGALEHFRAEENLQLAALLVTDVNRQNSLLVVKGDPDIIEQITYAEVEQKTIFELPGIVSRKKQLIPYLTTLIKALEA